MSFYADLHIHSRYSRATSRDSSLPHLSYWARRKGLTVLGTGDFTHPAWMEEIRTDLMPAEAGLFRLRREIERGIAERLPAACRHDVTHGAAPTRFMLQAEVCTIFKRSDRVHKVHHLVFVPELKQARFITDRLAKIGNIASDGCPMLGLDARDLLELTLEAGHGAFLVPAHIWTPWYSALGSCSGFDSIEACYGDLAEHVFAAETGLSSDPPMNRRISSMDRYRLISNSDAQSPEALGREACIFDCRLDFAGIRGALETGSGYVGTVDFFPEEGKYYLDGHRKCATVLSPADTRRHGGLCPVCGKPVTVGVLHRVEQLADRPEGFRPDDAVFYNHVPLSEILGETLQVSPTSLKARSAYEDLLRAVGTELFILQHADIATLMRHGSPLFAEGISRMRTGRVIRNAGYDGEYGTIRLFREEEVRGAAKAGHLSDLPSHLKRQVLEHHEKMQLTHADPPAPQAANRAAKTDLFGQDLLSITSRLDRGQRIAARVVTGPLLIVAGPGTGKTRTLAHRIAHLIADLDVPPEKCLTITFTRDAASEMSASLAQLLPEEKVPRAIMTFHALGWMILTEHASLAHLATPFRIVDTPADPASGTLALSDLARIPVQIFAEHPELAALYRDRYPYLSIDDFQEIDEWQYRLLRALTTPDSGLCACGDPDQSVCSFRGADPAFLQQFTRDFPSARAVHLTTNYRSTRTIVHAAHQAIAPAGLLPGSAPHALSTVNAPVMLIEAVSPRAEAGFVMHTIEQLIGGSTAPAMDGEGFDGASAYTFHDFAVLYRTEAQADDLVEAFLRAGIPFQKRSHMRLSENAQVRALLETMRGQADDGHLEHELLTLLPTIQVDPHSPDTHIATSALCGLAARCGSRDAFLAALETGDDVDLRDRQADCITLMTLHASKGLEFPVVFVIGCEDGILPLMEGDAQTAPLDEERRLLFVGMTRAREQLYLCRAERRARLGKMHKSTPTPFLADIQESMLERRRHAGQRRRAGYEQIDLFVEK